MINISQKLKSLRMLIGYNQKMMAEFLNISVTSYSQKETGKGVFTLKEAKSIADLFKVTVDELFFTE